MDVSFIIPLFNCLPLTQATLSSLKATLPPDVRYEIILVDDGSTDGTREWLSSLNDTAIRVLLNDRNLGYAGANNRGVQVATGTVLVLLNSDLILTPHWFEPMRILLGASDRIGIVGNVQLDARSGDLDHAGIFINAKGKPEHDKRPVDWRSKIRVAAAATGACLMITRQLWNDLGGFDEAFINGGEDVDLCLRARAQGRLTAIALKSVILHHVSSSPGRKNRDEANSRLLAQRWKESFIELGARAWCRDYLHRELTAATSFRDPFDSMSIAAHAVGITSSPPTVALEGMRNAIDLEIRRWDTLLR